MSPALAAPPVSVPPVTRWPPRRGWSDPGADQPPLPWAADGPAGSPVVVAEAAPHPGAPGARVRMVTTGSGWAPETLSGVPDPAPVCLRLTTAILEIRQGARPVQQLRHWFADQALAAVRLDAMRARHREPVTLRSLHLQRPSAVAVEAVAVYRLPDRDAVLALRLEARDRQWRCTAYETG